MCKKTLRSAIKFIQDSARKNHFAKHTFDHDGLLYTVDGYQILRTVEDFDDVEIVDVDKEWKEKTEGLFENEFAREETEYESPDYKELSRKIKELNAKSARVGYAIAPNILVNAKYLVNALKATGAKQMCAAGMRKPVIFYGEDTQYLLLPINNYGNLVAGELEILD